MAVIAGLKELSLKRASGVDFVRVLEEASTYEVPAPVCHYPNALPADAPGWQTNFCAPLVTTSPQIALYKLSNCLITVNGAIFVPPHSIVRESLYPYVREKDVLDAFQPNLVSLGSDSRLGLRVTIGALTICEESLFFAREHGETGYFHWLHSVLPRIMQYKQSDLGPRPFCVALTEEFQVESIRAIEIGESDLRRSNGTAMLCREMYFCTPMVEPDLSRSGGFFERSLYATKMLRSLLGQSPPGGRKLFVSRRDATIRRLANEDHVSRLLAERLGFETVTLSGLPFQEQVALFGSASAVVSMHGAGLSNIAFMNERGTVVELLAPDRLWPTYRGIAARAGLAYAPYVATRAGELRERDSDIVVDAEHLVEFISQAIELSPRS